MRSHGRNAVHLDKTTAHKPQTPTETAICAAALVFAGNGNLQFLHATADTSRFRRAKV